MAGQRAASRRKANPYGFIPFVIYPNLREPKQFWGVSDIPAIRESVRELNRALSQLSMILELSGNPIAVLENVSESQDIAVQPGAVWELPERARAYLLDLLQGGGVKLHVDYVDLIYRTLHDLGESPRTAFGENRQGLSGVALNDGDGPAAEEGAAQAADPHRRPIKRRNEMILRILEQQTGVAYAPVSIAHRLGAAAAAGPQPPGRGRGAAGGGGHPLAAGAPPTSWAWRTRRRSSPAGWRRSGRRAIAPASRQS